MKNQSSSNRRTIQRCLRLRALTLAIGMTACTPAALAHDFWIQPSTFICQVNTPVKVELRVGTAYPGDIVSRLDSRIVKFSIATAGGDGERPIAGQDGSQTAGVFRPEKPGLHILAYSSTPTFIKLKAANFETYLKDEGLE